MLLCGKLGSVCGLSLSLIASAVSDELEGVPICGLAGVAGESGRGLERSLLSNITGANFTGFQAAGLFNIIGDTL